MVPWRAATWLLPLLPVGGRGAAAAALVGGALEGHQVAGSTTKKHVGDGSVLAPVEDQVSAASDYLTEHVGGGSTRSPVEDEEEKWSHRVPLVQGDDQDFLKDENFDNGQWQLQNDYDRLRNRLIAARAARAAALHQTEVTQQRLDSARTEEEHARAKARQANAARRLAERKAEAALQQAHERYDEAERQRAKVGGVGAQQEQVNKAALELKARQRELDAARARLQALQAQKTKAEGKVREYSAEEQAAEEKEMEKEQEEAALEEKVDKETKESDKAHRQHEQTTAEEATTARKLKDSEGRLWRFRHPEQEVKSQACGRPRVVVSSLLALAAGTAALR